MDDWSDFSQYDVTPQKERTALGSLGDFATAGAKGVVSLGTGFVALADMVTPGDMQGWMNKNLGYDPKLTQAFLDDYYSIPQQDANKRVDAATGFFGTVEAMLENPSTLATGLVETLPSMAGGGAVARGIKYLPRVSKALGWVGRSAVGEGAITAGQQDLSVRETTGKETTLKQKGLSALAGIGTGLITGGGGKLAKRVGLTDFETIFAGGSRGTRGRVAGMAGGAVQEGLLEELPQSVQEQALQNIATDKPVSEGLGKAGAHGAVLGGMMGGGVNVLNTPQPKPKVKPESPNTARAMLAQEIDDSIRKLDDRLGTISSSIMEGINKEPINIYPDGTVTGAANPKKATPVKDTGPVYDISNLPTPSERKYLDAISDNQVSIQQQDDSRLIRNQKKQLPAGQGFELVNPGSQMREQKVPSTVKRELSKQAKEAVREDPVYKIMAETKKSGGINHKSMQDYPPETIRQIQKRYPGLISKKGTMQLDEIADQNGMTGDDLVEKLKSAPSITQRKKQVYNDLVSEWQNAEFERVDDLKTESNKYNKDYQKDQKAIEKEVTGIISSIDNGVSWANDKTIAEDKRFSEDQKNRILSAQDASTRKGSPTPRPSPSLSGRGISEAKSPLENTTESQGVGNNENNIIQQNEADNKIRRSEQDATKGLQDVKGKQKEKTRKSTPQKLAEAIGKPEAADNAALTGQTEDQQINQIVDDAITQPLNIAEMSDKKGKTELADQYRKKAQDNGDKLKAADGVTTETKVNEALGQPAKSTPTEGGRTAKGAVAEPDIVPSTDSKRAARIIRAINKTMPGNSLRYDGVQEGFGPVAKTHLFTPTEGPAAGTTFSVKTLSRPEVEKALKGKVDEYAKADKPKKFSKSSTPTTTTNVYQELSPHRHIKSLIDKGKIKIVQALPKELVGKVKRMVAYHGSPHDFDKFSTDNIGSGEGAQAYGHGLYFSGSKKVAEWYKDQLKDRDVVMLDGEQFYGEYAPNRDVIKHVFENGGSSDDAISAVKSNLEKIKRLNQSELPPDLIERVERDLQRITDGELSYKKSGKLYQVDLAPRQEEYLLWDKPLSEQSAFVQDALKNWENKKTLGSDLYKAMVLGSDSHKDGSARLHALGIRGIKYLDGTSRSKGEGNYNYVIFDDADVTIQAKYSKDGKVQGAYDPSTGTIYLVEPNISKGQAMPIVAHELGVHARSLGMTSNKRFKKILNSLKLRQNEKSATGEAIRAAMKRVPEDTPKSDFWEEVSAYLVEGNYSDDIPLVKRIVATVKRWLIELGVNPKILSKDDIVAFSHAALRKGVDNGKVEFSKTNPDIRYSVAGEVSEYKADRDLTEKQRELFKVIGVGVKEKKTLKERYKETTVMLGDKMRQGMVDQFHSLNKVLGDKKAWMLAHLTKSDTGVLMTAINEGAPVLDESGAVDIKENSKGLKEILSPLGEDVDRFLVWIASNRAERLLEEGRENLFTPDLIEAGKDLNKGNLADGKSKKEVYKNVRKDFEELGASITDIAVKTGLINNKEAARWREEGFYVPFYRMIGDQGETRGPSNIQSLSNQYGYKKLKGGKSQLDDLLTNTLMNWSHLISAGLKNQAGKQALETAESLGLANQIDKKFKSKDAIYIRDNGQEVWYELDETPEGQLVLDSLMSLNYEGMNNVAMKSMRMFKKALTHGVTASPGFKIRNLIRDSLHAPAVSTASKNPLKNIFVGIKDKKSMKRMEAGGGAFSQEGYIHGSDPNAIKQLVGVQRDNILDSPRRIKKMWRAYENFGNTLENINRVASFQKDLASGKSLLEANFNARDQLDFSRSGSFPAIRVITQTVPFLNARMQGLDKIGRSLADESQRKQFAQVVGMYTMASVALMLAMQGDDDYDEAENWEKRTYHLFKIPGSEKMYRIPRPFEVGSIGYVMEEMTKTFLDKNQDIKDLGKAVQHTITDTFAMNPVPQAFKPLLEIYANKNMFTGRKIESMSMQRLSKKERSKAWTSKTAKGASSLMSSVMPEDLTLSPVQVQHLVRAYTGWAGAQTLAAIDFIVKKASGEISPKVKLDEYKWNPLESLSRDKRARSSRYVTIFYDNLSQLNREWADVKKYQDKGKAPSVEELNRLEYRKEYNRLSRKLSKLRKSEAKIYTSSKLSAVEKRKNIKILQRRKNVLTKSIVESSRGVF